jgi:hypothetical protein
MANEKSGLEKWSSSSKTLLSSLRDGVFLVLFLLILFSPGTMNDRLYKAGFTEGNIGGMHWKAQVKQSAEQTKAAGGGVYRVDEQFNALINQMDVLENKVKDPSVKQSLATLVKEAKASQAELREANKAVTRSLSTQQSIVEAVSPSSVVSDRGWLFLGKVSQEKDRWEPGSPVAIAPDVPPSIGEGTKLTIRDDTYWWADSPTGQHVDAPILSVAKVGTIVSVDKVDRRHAKKGGWYIWIKAHRES